MNPSNFKKKVAISCILTLGLNTLPVQTFASQVSDNKDCSITMLDKSNDSYE